MASKIMLVLDNKDDQDFLEKVLERLKYTVISMKEGRDLSEQLIDHFPDVVFASTLGRNQKILSALGKIKEVRGKPKLVFVKQKNESHKLNATQKEIIDGTIYTPVDPFKLIDILAHTTEVDKVELRRRYNEMLSHERGGSRSQDNVGEGEIGHDREDIENIKIHIDRESKEKDYGKTQVFGKDVAKPQDEIEISGKKGFGQVDSNQSDDDKIAVTGKFGSEDSDSQKVTSKSQKNKTNSTLISDPDRQKKYKELTDRLNASGEKPKPINIQKLREAQAKQQAEVQEDKSAKKNRKHFLKTLFAMAPEDTASKK